MNILELIKQRTVFLDGAMGSLLIAEGLEPGTPPEYWNIVQPDKIKHIHQGYFLAGSDAVLTNTFGGSRLKLAAHKHDSNIEEYNSKAVQNAQEVCPDNGFIGGDIGPSGSFLPPVGNITIEQFYNNFLEQATILAEAGVDFFFIETMSDINEAEAAIKAAKEASKVPILASMTYKKTKRGYFTIMGNSVEECITRLEKAGADAVGSNCTLPSYDMIDLIPLMKRYTKLPIIAKPNAGLPELVDGETIYHTTQNEFAKDIEKIVKQKASIVGGCCGTNPSYLERIVQELKV